MPMELRNGKWEGIWDKPKYQEIRDKITEAFKDLEFEEGPHKYYLHGKEMESVSNVTHEFKPHFDKIGKATRTWENHSKDPNSIYFGMTVDDIIKYWENNANQACTHGTERHECGESLFYFMTGQYDKILDAFKDRLTQHEDGSYTFKLIYPKEIAQGMFYENLPVCYIPIYAETRVFDEDLEYAGTFDILFYYDAELDPKNNFESGLVIMDWKTNKSLETDRIYNHMKAPFGNYPECPLSVYYLQLAAYQNCLEKIGLKVIARRILWLRGEDSSGNINGETEFKVYKTPELTQLLVEAIKYNKSLK